MWKRARTYKKNDNPNRINDGIAKISRICVEHTYETSSFCDFNENRKKIAANKNNALHCFSQAKLINIVVDRIHSAHKQKLCHRHYNGKQRNKNNIDFWMQTNIRAKVFFPIKIELFEKSEKLLEFR